MRIFFKEEEYRDWWGDLNEKDELIKKCEKAGTEGEI